MEEKKGKARKEKMIKKRTKANKLNKKAQLGHGITWLWKFLLLILVFGGTIGIVILHYSKQIDIRKAEAAAISRKIMECIAPEGILNKLDQQTIKECLSFNEEEIYLNISTENQTVEIGKPYLITLCEVKEKGVSVKSYPSCLESKYLVLKQDSTSDPTYVTIKIAIRKTEKNL